MSVTRRQTIGVATVLGAGLLAQQVLRKSPAPSGDQLLKDWASTHSEIALERPKRLFALTGKDLQTRAAPDIRSLNDVTLTHGEALRYILGHIWPDDSRGRLLVLATLASSFGQRWAQSTAPECMARLTNSLADSRLLSEADSEDWSEIVRNIIGFGAAKVAVIFFREIRSVTLTHLIKKADQQMAAEMFQVLQNTDLDFLLRNRPGELASNVLTSSRALGAFLNNISQRALPLYLDLSSLARKFKKMKASEVNQIAKATLAVYFAFSFLYGDFRVAQRLRANAVDSLVRGRMLESLQNAESVRALHTGVREVKSFVTNLSCYEHQRTGINESLATMNIVQQLIMRGGVTAAVLLTADKVFRGDAKPGDLQMVFHMFDGLMHPLNFVGTMYREFKTNYKEIVQGLKLLKVATINDKPGAAPLVINRGSIQIRDLSFGYPSTPNNKLVLKNLNLSIMGKSKVAIVGPSGSGKSTLLRLILRLYQPTRGLVGICGQDISGVTLKSLRENVTLVPQDPLLFNASLRENLLYGLTETLEGEALERRLAEAVRAAALEDVVKKIGLDGNVGERGSALSGGERQRVAIARAMVRDTPIVLLDEPTSGLDATNQRLVLDAIEKLRRDKTVVMVAHKLATIADSDEIVYLEEGLIKERGSFEQLMAQKGRYYQQWTLQEHGGDADDAPAGAAVAEMAPGASSCSGGTCCHD